MKRSVFSARSKGRMRRNVLGLVVVMIVAGLLVWQGQSGVNIGLSVFNTVVAPVQGVITRMVSSINGYFGKIAFSKNLELEYTRLYEQYMAMESELNSKNEENAELRRLNEQLTTLLNYAEKYPEYDTIHARVIGKDPSNWLSVFTINRGSNQGIEKDMNVINESGLIGRIIEVYPNSSMVMTIVDSRSSVSGIVDRTRDDGIVSGNMYLDSASGAFCRMYYLPEVKELRPGDMVKTSGTDMLYHKGIAIGTVREISRVDTADKYVVIEPTVDFSHLEEVLVIRGDLSASNSEAVEAVEVDALQGEAE